MSADDGTPLLPTTLENPEEWTDIATAIGRETGSPPATDAHSLAAFVGEAVRSMYAADNSGQFDDLRQQFSARVVGQLSTYKGLMDGFAPTAVTLSLIGAPRGDTADPIVRFRVRISDIDVQQHLGTRLQFWDVQMGGNSVVIGSSTCPNCGAPLAGGTLVCPYCRTDTRRRLDVPLLVVKLERVS